MKNCAVFLNFTSAFILVSASGCMSYSSPAEGRISPGLTAKQIMQRCGKPKSVEQDQKVEIWTYEWNSAYDMKIGGMFDYLYFEDGKLVGACFDSDSIPAAKHAAFMSAWAHAQEVQAYNARTEALAKPVEVDVKVSGHLDHYHTLTIK